MNKPKSGPMDQAGLRTHPPEFTYKRRRQSPLVRKWLREYQIDAAAVTHFSNDERLTKRDVEKLIANNGAAILRTTGMS